MFVKLFTLVLACLTVTVLTDDSCENWMNHKNFNLVHSGGACGQAKINDQDSLTTKVLNGITASPGSLPWMAYIETEIERVGDMVSLNTCGGSVINENYILTAAHCEVKASKLSKVTLGLHNTDCVRKDCEPQAEIYHVTTYIEHPDYDYKSLQNDIALLRLDRKISFESPLINYICLPTSCDLSNKNWFREDLTVAGWGLIGMTQRATTLQNTVTPVTECDRYKIANFTEVYSPVPSQLCTEGRDTMACSGDSGGPITYDTADRVVQVGLSSFGPTDCSLYSDDKMNYFTKVTSFMPWILDNIEP